MKPFPTRSEAAYWGRGVLAEATGGGWYSLHAISYPNGVHTLHVGVDDSGKTIEEDGFPQDTVHRYMFTYPDDGSPRCICIVEGDQSEQRN